MNKLLAIASVAIREALRQKLAANLLVFAVALVAASLTISALTFGEQYRIIVDLGLSAMEVFGTLIATFLGAGLVARDVERRSVYPVIAKPVTRTQYVAGRYLGLLATTALNLLVMALVFALVLAIYTGGFGFVVDTPFLLVLLSLVVRFAMVTAVATFFSTFTTTTLAAIFTLSLVVAGQLASDLVKYWSTKGPWAGRLGTMLYVVVPNLEALNLKEAMVYKDAVAPSFAWTGLGYGLAYAAGVVAVAAAVFSRRDLR
ncbi:MAG: ABC transporter permease [Anaeromyxobacteraceae bacterium]|nr:ABC transporter permease [Anaeromyxobacteraceae bacterium]